MENAVCHFVFYTGPRKGEAQVYDTARVSIGRAANCDFRLEAFQLDQVAPHHAELLLEEGKTWCIYDLGTKSGTWVNGERVHERCVLMSEDYVRFGLDGPELIFRIGHPVPGRQPLPEMFPVTAELEFFSGSDAGRIFPINAAITSNIGRRADLEVPLDPRGDMIVSGNHCNIRYVNGHFVLTDTSRNGTYVNNELVDQPMEILDGDVIMLGDGGPQSRFHVDEARRHYPNHRPLTKKPEAQSTSSFQSTPTGTPSAPAVLASAKPFLSGSNITPVAPPPVDTPLSPEAEAINQEVADVVAPPVADDAATSAVTGISAAAAAAAGSDEPGLPDFMSELSPDEVVAADGAGEPGTAHSEAVTPKDGVEITEDFDEVESSASTAAPAAGAPVADTVATDEEAARSGRSADTGETGIPSGGGKSWLSTVPKAPRLLKGAGALPFSRKQMMIGGGLAGALLLIIIIAVATSGDDGDSPSAGRADYAAALKKAEPVENVAGAYTVQVPEGWTQLNRENYVSIESADKDIAVDYVRDPRITQDSLMQALQRDGAAVSGQDSIKTKDQTINVIRAKVGNVERAGALVATGTAPLMVIVEATEDAMKKLSDDGLEKLMVANVKATGPVATSAPAQPVAPTPAPEAALPSPEAATPAVADNAGQTTSSVAASADQPTTTSTTEVAAAADETPAGPAGPLIESKALKLKLTIPEGWTGASEEEDEMIMVADGNGLVIRIARDPGDLDAEATFNAMEEERWKKEGVKNTERYNAGEFTGNNQNLMLILIPEKAKTTLLVYATSKEDFTEAQRYGIRDILVQLVEP